MGTEEQAAVEQFLGGNPSSAQLRQWRARLNLPRQFRGNGDNLIQTDAAFVTGAATGVATFGAIDSLACGHSQHVGEDLVGVHAEQRRREGRHRRIRREAER